MTVGLGGSVADISDDAGLDAAFCILREPMTLNDAMNKSIAAKNISATAAQIIKLLAKLNQRTERPANQNTCRQS